MPSVFADLEHLVSDAVNSTMGERTSIVPKTKGGYFKGSADAERAVVEVIGAVTINPVAVLGQDMGSYDGMLPGVVSDKIHVSYDERLLPWVPKQGDEVLLLDRASMKLRVSRSDPDGCGRIDVVCVRGAEE